MILRSISILATACILTACGGSSSSGSDKSPVKAAVPTPPPVKEVFSPESKSIETVNFVDALNKPLASAEVVFTPINKASNFSAALADDQLEDASCSGVNEANAITSTTSETGELSLKGLDSGIYQVQVCKAGVSVSIKLKILAGNAASSAAIAVPVISDEDGKVTVLPKNNLLLSISGTIYSDEGVVKNAQVALSGGALTNGAISTVITDENGFYSIIINVNKNKLPALQDATFQIVAEGFERLNISGQDFTQFAAFSGVNLKLMPVDETKASLVYEENFEVLSGQATCGAWTSETLEITPIEEGAPIANLSLPSLWHSHDSGLSIVNQAYVKGLVLLAPNDTSSAKVPEPIEGNKACWYGKATGDGSLEQGNFLNEASEDQTLGGGGIPNPTPELAKADGKILNGGLSKSNHAGAIVSPRMDFSSEVAPLALTFKTWWEIEAVNPNENGFDLMSVEYQIEGEESWNTFVRLNPLTDPVGFQNLEALPFSNAGFNLAPFWVEQAPISLNRLAGKVFKLRFTFSTQDALFNGFRGWLIDDVKISKQEGIFPLWDEVDRIFREGAEFSQSKEVGSDLTEFSIKLKVRSQNAVLAQFRMYDLSGEPISAAFGIVSLNKDEAQDITLIAKTVEPKENYRLMVELVGADGRIWANAPFYLHFENDESDEES